MDHELEVPQYFLCPISLQIMKDPVTAATGITYDRESIEYWLKTANESVCPVTKQPLLGDTDLTPNHTLRRLIQGWCVANARHGVERIPTPKAALGRTHIMKIIRGLNLTNVQPSALDQLLSLATSEDHVKDRKLLAECGVVKAMVSLINKCHKEKKMVASVEKALRIVTAIWTPTSTEVNAVVVENYELVDAITWILTQDVDNTMKNLAILLMKDVIKVLSSSLKERLKPEFFKGVVNILKTRGQVNDPEVARDHTIVGPTKAALRVLLEVCQHGRNRCRIIETDAIFELIELELDLVLPQSDRKKVSELIFCLLAQLCSCADGRAQFLVHSGGVAVVSKRILRVSPVVDDRAVHIFAQISKCSATNEALHEMLRVGAVSKLCMVLQADSAKYLKDKVREMLRMHAYVWNNSPCIQVYLSTRYPMTQF